MDDLLEQAREALMDQIRATAFEKVRRSDHVALLERRGELVDRHGCDKARALLALLKEHGEEEG